jgi:hypothetical protein
MTARRQLLTNVFLLFFGVWDAVLAGVAIAAPAFWFRMFHAAPLVDPQGLLARTGAVWAAFALFHLIAWRVWRKYPWWLVIVGGMRLSEIFADLTYMLKAESITTSGRISLLLATPSNIFFSIFFISGFLVLQRTPSARSS